MSGMELLVAGSAAMTAGGGALSAYGQSMQGREQARAAMFEKQQLEVQAQQARTAADQSEARRREELTSNLETIQVIRGGRGVGTSSPTGQAIMTSTIEDQDREIATERLNYLQRADTARRGAEMAERKARTSLLAGDLSAASTILSTGSKVANMYAFPTSKKG
jgi:hypothetical protein